VATIQDTQQGREAGRAALDVGRQVWHEDVEVEWINLGNTRLLLAPHVRLSVALAKHQWQCKIKPVWTACFSSILGLLC
jgi:hypothetical protein